MSKGSKYIIVVFSLAVAALHFIIGPHYTGCCKVFFTSYLTDIVLPMNVYLLFQVALRPKLSLKRSVTIGYLATFLIGLSVEMSQYFGIPIFGSTYDPLDIFMYFLGATAGVIFDLLIIQTLERKTNK